MAIRTDSSSVLLRLDTVLTTAQVDGFIADASGWVDDNLAGETEIGVSTLERIELYLACHLCTLRDPRLTAAKLDDVDEKYQRDASETEYLAMARALDPTGRLGEAFGPKAESGRRVQFRVGDGFDSRHDY